MMGSRQIAQGALFYEFSIENHVPCDHLLRRIDRFVDLSDIVACEERLVSTRRGFGLGGADG